MYFDRAVIAPHRFHFPNEVFEPRFADTFDAPFPIGTKTELFIPFGR